MAQVNLINNQAVNYVPLAGASEGNLVQQTTTEAPLTVSEGGSTATTPSVPCLDDVDPKVLERMSELLGTDYEALIELLTNDNAEANIKAMIETLTKKLDAAKANKEKRLEQAKKFLDFMDKNAAVIDKLTKGLTRGGFFGQLQAAHALMQLTKDLTGQDLSFWSAMSMARGLIKAVRDPSKAADIIGKVAQRLEDKFESKGMGSALAEACATMMTGVISLSVTQAAANRTRVSGFLHRILPKLADRIESRRMERVAQGFATSDGRESTPYESMARNLLTGAIATGAVTDFFKAANLSGKDDAELEELAKMLAKLVAGESEELSEIEELINDLEESIGTLVELLGQITESKDDIEGSEELQNNSTMA